MKPKLAASLALVVLTSLAGGAGLLTPRPSAAFCGFYVAGADAKLFSNATMVVLMRDGKRTVLSMQNDYQGPPEGFALVIPVPVVLQEADVKVLRKDLFERVDKLAAPRLVEYWEQDPCEPDWDEFGLGLGLVGKGGGGTGSGYGRGGGSSTVTVEAEFAVGEYEIVILSATESNGLDSWLRDNDYNIPAGAEPLLRPYVEQGMKFFVAKVDPKQVEFGANGQTMLSPLRFHYDSDEFSLPIRLGLINAPDPTSGAKQDLLVHIVAPNTRYELSNYKNVTIPTNLDVHDAVKRSFGEFYVALFDHTIEQNPGAVVTEYAWSAGKCDPCPEGNPPLTTRELLELGGDVLPHWSQISSDALVTPLVRAEPPTVTGALDKDIVRRIIRAHINEVRFCYISALGQDPALVGPLNIDFTIASSGKVASASVGSSPAKELSNCVAKAVERWQFPKPRGGGLVTVKQAFMLQPTGGPRGGGMLSSAADAFVVTRLHARYDASSLGEDLVFQAAGPIVGGREAYPNGTLETGAQPSPSSLNNFQARYAIRHAWQGEVACEAPSRGRWGGPPGGGSSSPTIARQLASAERGASLGSFVTASAREQLGIGAAAIAEPATPEPAASESPAPVEPARQAPAVGCSCSSEGEPSLPAAALGLFALLGLRRRRGTH